MKVLIVGTGAVGGYYGGLLARAGHDVTFVARGEHGRVIRERGLVLQTPSGRHVVHGSVRESIEDAAGLAAELAVVAVKATSLGDVTEGLGRSLAEDGVALPLLNGLDSEQLVAAVIGRPRVIGGVAEIASTRSAPGSILVLGGGRLILAPLLSEQRPRVKAVAAAFVEAGVECRVRDDLSRVLWQKLLWNVSFNGVCALTGLTSGQALEIASVEELVREVMAEALAVARAEGIEMEASIIDRMIDVTREHHAHTEPSMLQDVRAGRPTESSALQGAVVERGKRHGVPTPASRALLALLQGIDRRHAAGSTRNRARNPVTY